MTTHVHDLAGVCSGNGPCDTHPTGHGGDNFVTRGGGFDPYLRAIINALKRKGHPESRAVQIAIGTVQRWARGEGNVTAATRARAAASLAHWEALKAKAHALTAEPAATVDLAFTEALHPRNKGKFAPKGSATTSGTSATTPAEMTANVRDFQRRLGLPVTGVIDAATRAAIQRETAAKGGGGRKGKKRTKKAATKKAAAHARVVQQQTLGQHVATVNSMTAGQRTELRQRMPVPPTGYVWGKQNTLRRVKLTRAQQTAPLTGP